MKMLEYGRIRVYEDKVNYRLLTLIKVITLNRINYPN